MKNVSSTADWDYSAIFDVVIDRPAKDVWPYFFGRKRDAWAEHDFVPIAGEPGKVGEIYASGERKLHGVRWIMYTIRAKPEKQLVLKMTYQANDKAEEKLGGYDIIELKESAGRTTVGFRQAVAVSIDALDQKDLKVVTEEQDTFLNKILQNLKRMVEKGE
jgi:hypothetical protein